MYANYASWGGVRHAPTPAGCHNDFLTVFFYLQERKHNITVAGLFSSTHDQHLATSSQSALDQPPPTSHMIAVSGLSEISGDAQSCVTHAACSLKSLTGGRSGGPKDAFSQ